MNDNYVIVLADGTELKNLRLNGSNYISTEEVDKSMFDGNCSPILVTKDGEVLELHKRAELVHLTKYNGEWWFAFSDITDQEIKERKIRSDIDYIAMMSDISLDEGE